MALEHLRLEDLSDRELLLVMLDQADSEGFVDPMDLADVLGVVGEHPRRVVTARLAWLKRWGAVEREHQTDDHGNAMRFTSGPQKGQPRPTQRYRLTAVGFDMANGSLRAAQEKALAGMDDGQMLLVTQWLTKRARESGTTVATLVRREWTYRTMYSRNGSR